MDRLLVGLLANGHVLLEGVPGLAKEGPSRLASAVQAIFRRIHHARPPARRHRGQSDLQSAGREVSRHQGPVFTNFLLADEIIALPPRCNRPARSYAGTSGDARWRNDAAAVAVPRARHGNPIDQEGRIHCPRRRWIASCSKVILDYPSEAEERKILDRMAFTAPENPVKPVVGLDEILKARKLVDQIHVDDKVRDYIVQVVFATRQPEKHKLDIKNFIQFGASPRATIYLTLAAKAWALLQGRTYVTPGT